jgi:hypothetical protein
VAILNTCSSAASLGRALCPPAKACPDTIAKATIKILNFFIIYLFRGFDERL